MTPVFQVPDASLHASHALPWTPADPRAAPQHASSVSAAGACKPSPSACAALPGRSQAWGRAVSPAVSVGPWVRFPWFVRLCGLLSRCPTRYGCLVRPSPVRTSTPQEAPSFAWRTNASGEPRPEAAATEERRLLGVGFRVEPAVTQPARRVGGRDCSRQAPSERHVQVSRPAAQALRTSP
jgi:hypothetical protein